jgi:integrase
VATWPTIFANTSRAWPVVAKRRRMRPFSTPGGTFCERSNLDLAAARIAKRDAQGRTVDVHSLRHTFATLLARKGVSPSAAQKLMRHSDIRLTMNTYTHLDLADTASAVAALPKF